MFNVAPVTNTFLATPDLVNVCYRLFDNVSMKTYFWCGCRGDKKTFKETKICGGIANKRILFI